MKLQISFENMFFSWYFDNHFIVGFRNIQWQKLNLNSHKFMQEFAKRHRARHWIWGAFFSEDYEFSILILNAKDVNEDWKSFQGYIYKWLTCVKFIMSLICTWAPEISPLSWYYFRICLPILHIIADLRNQFCLTWALWKPISVFCKLETHFKHFWK